MHTGSYSAKSKRQLLNFKISPLNSVYRPIETTKEQIWWQFLETQNSDNSGSINSRDSKFCQKVLTLHYARTILQNFSPLSPAVQKLLPKVFIFYSFQDPCSDSFQDHCIVLTIGSFVYVICSKGKSLIQISFQDPHTSTITHFSG